MMDGQRAARLSVAMLAIAISLIALVWADPLQPQNLYPIDTWWHDLALTPGGIVRSFARGMETAGGGWAAFAVRVAVGSWLAVRRRWADLAAWLLAWGLTELVVNGLKANVGRLRPDGTDALSFPSGHAATAGQIAVGLALLTERLGHPRLRWTAAVAWVAVMAWSRTALDVHYLSDVLAGALLGAAEMFGAWSLTRRWAVEPPSLASEGRAGADSTA